MASLLDRTRLDGTELRPQVRTYTFTSDFRCLFAKACTEARYWTASPMARALYSTETMMPAAERTTRGGSDWERYMEKAQCTGTTEQCKRLSSS